MSVAIHWFRRDLRLTDNTALNAALAAHDQVVPLFIASQWSGQHHWCGAPRLGFLCNSLESLHKNLEAKGGRLIVRTGQADMVLERLTRETGATAIFYNRDPDPFGREMEKQICAMSERVGLAVNDFKDIAINERDEVLTGKGRPFRVFTPFAKAWNRLNPLDVGRTISRIAVPESVETEPLPRLENWKLTNTARILTGGEAAARKRLARFLDGPILEYASKRNLPGDEGASRLSQDLRFGLLSIREVLRDCRSVAAKAKAVASKRSVAVFINELVWREFYFQVLSHWPNVLDEEFQADYRKLRWRAHWRPGNDDAWQREPKAREDFVAWCEGRTGFPIVDAGMRQLAATGYMHNRVRMIAAMFLTKDLRIWWMHGESHFMRLLVDGEIASNNGGWQWSASTGTDAAPYFRIQNPWVQTKRYDSEGAYIKRWVAELKDVPPAKFFAPPGDGEPIARGYVSPMVDHSDAREATLAMFKAARFSAEGALFILARPAKLSFEDKCVPKLEFGNEDVGALL